MGTKHHVEIDIEQLTSADLYWRRDELAKREAYLRSSWHEFEANAKPNERESLMAVMRATLLRLAETEAWIPGALAFSKGRIDMHISVDLTVADTLVHMGPTAIEHAAGSVRRHLEALVERLEGMDDGE